jgi:hypothetical protein
MLLAVTAFAIGFPVWYRWPYEEKFIDASTGTVARITTWQRQWGGGRLQHGSETRMQGDLLQRSHYRYGSAHGPYLVKHKDKTLEMGQHVDGQREGVWTVRCGDCTANVNWHRGKLHGPSEFKTSRGRQLAVFNAGRLTQLDDRAVQDVFFDLVNFGGIDERTLAELGKTTEFLFVEMPIKDAVAYLSDRHNMVILLDSPHAQHDLPLTTTICGIDLRAALALLSSAHGVECDYRFGSVWITSAARAGNRRDPTGISGIKFSAGSATAHAWDEPVQIEVVKVPLAQALDFFAQKLGVEIDSTRIQPTPQSPTAFAVTHTIKGFPFRHVLGQLLYKTGCRCRMENGERLVILPPEE